MWMGRLRFEPPMLFAVGFIGLFIIGGLSGIMLAVYPIDQYTTDTYFVVAHFHYVLGTVPVFAVMAGVHFWYPKITGRMLDRKLAVRSFWVLFIAFNLTFFPMHAAGLSGMPTGVATYTEHSWQIYNQLATIGALLLAVGVMMVLWNCISSLRYGRIAPNDPWGGNSLEWYTTSPPPAAQLRRPAPDPQRAPAVRPATAAGRGRSGDRIESLRCSISEPPTRTSASRCGCHSPRS